MSFRVAGEVVEAPLEAVRAFLLDKARTLSLLPRDLLEPLDREFNRVQINLRRGIFGFRGFFDVRVEVAQANVVVYVFESPRARINLKLLLEARDNATLINVEIEGFGFNILRFKNKINDILARWIRSLKFEIELKGPRPVAERPTAPRVAERVELSSAGARHADSAVVSEAREVREASRVEVIAASDEDLLAGSRRLADPLFEADILLRGRVVRVERLLLTKVADIVERESLAGALDLSKNYVIRVELARARATILLEKGKLRGAYLEEDGKKLLAIDALRRLQELLPAEALVTLIEVEALS